MEDTATPWEVTQMGADPVYSTVYSTEGKTGAF